MHLRPHCGRAGHAHHRRPTLGAESTLDGTDSLVADGLTTLGDYYCTLAVPRLDADGGLDIPAIGVSLSIVGTALNNHADATWQILPGYNDLIYLDAGASINNLAGATFTVSGGGGGSDAIEPGDSSAVAFNNAGTFIASTSTVAGDDVEIHVPFANSGSVQLQQGTLNLSGTGSTPSTGSFTAAAGTTLGLDGQVLAASSVVSSDGSVSIEGSAEAGSYAAAGGTFALDTSFTGPVVALGASLEVDGPVSFAPASGGPVTLTTGALTLDAESTLDGTDSLVADGLTTLGDYYCTLAVPRLDADGGLDIPAIGVSLSIVGTALNNHADATWQILPGYNDLIYLDAGASINNLAGATFTVSGGGGGSDAIEPGDSSAVAFNNAGTFIASTSTVAGDDVEINVPFANSGSVLAPAGDRSPLAAPAPTPSTGSFTAAAGTTLDLDGQVAGRLLGRLLRRLGDLHRGPADSPRARQLRQPRAAPSPLDTSLHTARVVASWGPRWRSTARSASPRPSGGPGHPHHRRP